MAQVHEGCHFLKGNFTQVGIAPNGAFGTPQNVPVSNGYFARPTPGSSRMNNPANNTNEARPLALGFVADYGRDGFTVGSPAYFGDYFMPGTVQEGWSIQAGIAVRGDAWSNNYTKTGTPANGYVGNLLGNLLSYSSTGNLSTSIWDGVYENSIAITQTVTLNATKSYFVINVEFTNTSTSIVNDIYYLRTVDADCDVQFSSAYSTINKIPFSLPNASGKSLVTSSGTSYRNAFVGLGTKDCKARPFYLNNGLFPIGNSLKDVYNQLNTGYLYGDSSRKDVGIGLVFEIGNLAPGEKTTIAYAYVLNEDDLDDAFAATQPGFRYDGNFYPSGSIIVKPTGTAIDIEIVNSGPYSWNWSPPTNLSTTTGINVTATVDVGPTTYTISGSGVGTGRCSNPNLEIIVSPSPVITKPSVVSPINLCLNQTPFPLEATGAGIITWYNSLTAISGTTTAPLPNTTIEGVTTWYATLTTSLGESIRVPVVVNVLPIPTISISSLKNEICLNDTTVLNVVTNGFRTKWTVGATSLNIDTGKTVIAKPFTNTTYTAEVTSALGCKAISIITITVHPLPTITVTATPNSTICPKDSVQLTATSTTGVLFNWVPTSFLNNSTATVVVSKPITNITYTAIATDARGCTNSNDINLSVINFILPKLGNDTSICFGDSLILNPGLYTNYTWQNGTINNTLIAKNAGKYFVLVNDAFGCKGTDTLNIIAINNLPKNYLPNDTIICKGQPLTVTINGFTSYNWSNGSINKTSILRDLGKYYLKVVDNNGCKGIDSISLINKGCVPFLVPNAFTPNNDGKNDNFKPFITQQLTNYLLRIYNRYGQIVFETQDVFKGWNGNLQGRKQPAGAYVYQIKFNDYDNTPQLLEGSLLLIR